MDHEELFGGMLQGFNRRDFLKTGTMGLLTAGLTFSGFKMLEEEAHSAVICDKIYIMAKHSRTPKVSNFSCLPCDCDPNQYQIKHKIAVKLFTAPSCDESQGVIPDGSKFTVNLTRTFRLIGPHNFPVGCHEGAFVLKHLDGTTLASGKMKGIDGMTSDHLSKGMNFCDQPWHDEGCIEGKGKDGTILGNCTLHGTYVSRLDATSWDVMCKIDPWLNWQIHLTVCVHCPC